jgi:hypothetical protein
VSPGAWDAIDLALCLLFAAGSFYYYVLGGPLRGPRDVALGGSRVPRLLRCGGRVLREGPPVRLAGKAEQEGLLRACAHRRVACVSTGTTQAVGASWRTASPRMVLSDYHLFTYVRAGSTPSLGEIPTERHTEGIPPGACPYVVPSWPLSNSARMSSTSHRLNFICSTRSSRWCSARLTRNSSG